MSLYVTSKHLQIPFLHPLRSRGYRNFETFTASSNRWGRVPSAAYILRLIGQIHCYEKERKERPNRTGLALESAIK